MNILRTAVFFLIFLFICLSCAKQSSPSGGPKDTIPPKLIRSIPLHKQTNFKSKKIELIFSEDIILNNPKEQLIITPTTNKKFTATNKKKEVTIEFEEDFKDSTTYTLSFRDAIQDITEKNTVKNLQLAFSTGTFIDSLLIEGKVFDLQKNTEIKDATIALYQQIDTFSIFKHKPTYITRSNEKGFFRLENLKNGTYQIYAFEDKNKNLIADSKNESYGFLRDTLKLSKNIKGLSIPLQHLDSRTLKLTSARPYNNYFNIKTGKNLASYQLTSDTVKLISNFGEDRASVRVYNTFKSDSIKVRFTAIDSIGSSIDTTLYVKFSKKKSEPEKFSMGAEDTKIDERRGILETKLTFNKPISIINFDSVFFQPDSTSIIKFTDKELTWDYSTNTVTIKKTIEKKYLQKEVIEPLKDSKKAQSKTPKKVIKNEFVLGKGAFISIDGDSSKSRKENLKILREEETGVILVTIKTSEKNFITELLNSSFKVIETAKSNKSVKFEYLQPSSYIIKLIIDKNGNGKWDAGNFFKREEPEPILFYRNEKKDMIINLKANWELGPLLITY